MFRNLLRKYTHTHPYKVMCTRISILTWQDLPIVFLLLPWQNTTNLVTWHTLWLPHSFMGQKLGRRCGSAEFSAYSLTRLRSRDRQACAVFWGVCGGVLLQTHSSCWQDWVCHKIPLICKASNGMSSCFGFLFCSCLMLLRTHGITLGLLWQFRIISYVNWLWTWIIPTKFLLPCNIFSEEISGLQITGAKILPTSQPKYPSLGNWLSKLHNKLLIIQKSNPFPSSSSSSSSWSPSPSLVLQIIS